MHPNVSNAAAFNENISDFIKAVAHIIEFHLSLAALCF